MLHKIVTFVFNRSHMTAICLIFWFVTISVSVTASAIYLLKRMEAANSKPYGATTVGLSTSGGGRGKDSDNYQDAYANYDVLGNYQTMV